MNLHDYQIPEEDYLKAIDITLELLDAIFAHAIDRRDPQLEELAKAYRKDFKYLASKKHHLDKELKCQK